MDANTEATTILITFLEPFIVSSDSAFPADCPVDRAKAICSEWTANIPKRANVAATNGKAALERLYVPYPQDSEKMKKDIQMMAAHKLFERKKTLNKEAQSALDGYDENNRKSVEEWAKAQLRAISANELFGRWPPKAV